VRAATPSKSILKRHFLSAPGNGRRIAKIEPFELGSGQGHTNSHEPVSATPEMQSYRVRDLDSQPVGVARREPLPPSLQHTMSCRDLIGGQ